MLCVKPYSRYKTYVCTLIMEFSLDIELVCIACLWAPQVIPGYLLHWGLRDHCQRHLILPGPLWYCCWKLIEENRFCHHDPNQVSWPKLEDFLHCLLEWKKFFKISSFKYLLNLFFNKKPCNKFHQSAITKLERCDWLKKLFKKIGHSFSPNGV